MKLTDNLLYLTVGQRIKFKEEHIKCRPSFSQLYEINNYA